MSSCRKQWRYLKSWELEEGARNGMDFAALSLAMESLVSINSEPFKVILTNFVQHLINFVGRRRRM